MDENIKELYRVYLKPNIYRREFWRCRRDGNKVTVVFFNDYEDTFEEIILEPKDDNISAN